MMIIWERKMSRWWVLVVVATQGFVLRQAPCDIRRRSSLRRRIRVVAATEIFSLRKEIVASSSTTEKKSRHPRWRVVASWARWQRASLLAYLCESERFALRTALANYASSVEATESAEERLSARLEIAEVMLTIGADGAAIVAAFLHGEAMALSEKTNAIFPAAAALCREMRILRESGLWTPLMSSDREEESISSLWFDMDATASVLRKSVALATRDARALLAELAALVVLLRRSTAPEIAVQAIHMHLPLAELLKNARHHHQQQYRQLPASEEETKREGKDEKTQDFKEGDVIDLVETRRSSVVRRSETTKETALFSASAYAALVREIEDRAYSALFPGSYSALRSRATTAMRVIGAETTAMQVFGGAATNNAYSLEIFASRVRALLADHLSTDADFVQSLFGDETIIDLQTAIAERLVVSARVKSPASALRKMLKKRGGTVGSVRDVLGLRVVLLPKEDYAAEEEEDQDDDIAALYAIYDATKDIWEELEGRFKDYVAQPKPNGYRSLHTTVWLAEVPMEIQMRTLTMHAVAETGLANHDLYEGLRRDEALATELLDEPLYQRRLLPGVVLQEDAISSDDDTDEVVPIDVVDDSLLVEAAAILGGPASQRRQLK